MDPNSSSHNGVGIFTSKRNKPPADYLFKIDSYSLLMNKKYESNVFEAAGHKWELVLFPGDNSKRNDKNHVGLYLRLTDTQKFSPGWTLDVHLKMFIVDQNREQYLTVQFQDPVHGDVQTFSESNTELGFDQLISLKDLFHKSNGYVVDDSCHFGVEVFVIGHSAKSETLHMVKNPTRDHFKWPLKNFSTLDSLSGYDSKNFVGSEGTDWILRVYPRGCDATVTDDYLSLYLGLKNCGRNRTVYASYTLKIFDQRHITYYEQTGSGWFHPPSATAVKLQEAKDAATTVLATSNDVGKKFQGAAAKATGWLGSTVIGNKVTTAIANKVTTGVSAAVINWGNAKGFPKFISLSELKKPGNGYVKKDAIVMEVDIHISMIKISS